MKKNRIKLKQIPKCSKFRELFMINHIKFSELNNRFRKLQNSQKIEAKQHKHSTIKKSTNSQLNIKPSKINKQTNKVLGILPLMLENF